MTLLFALLENSSLNDISFMKEMKGTKHNENSNQREGPEAVCRTYCKLDHQTNY
jgi:hypothetical protein